MTLSDQRKFNAMKAEVEDLRGKLAFAQGQIEGLREALKLPPQQTVKMTPLSCGGMLLENSKGLKTRIR